MSCRRNAIACSRALRAAEFFSHQFVQTCDPLPTIGVCIRELGIGVVGFSAALPFAAVLR